VVILDAEEKYSLGSDILLNVRGRDNSVIIGGKWKVAAEYKRFSSQSKWMNDDSSGTN
jgi:hypothetical protein